MRKLTFLLIMLAIGLTLKCQSQVTTLKFSETQHDFGTFNEDDGKQTFDFIVTNTGTQPLIIQKVEASRLCPSPEWTKTPIAPGETGTVTGIWNPASKLGTGAFKKTLTVYANTVPPTTMLTIMGVVTPHVKTLNELFSFAVGGVRMESNQFEFSTVLKSGITVKEMQVVNTSPNPVKVEFMELPAHLKLKVDPETLQPEQKGRIIGTYDGKANPAWGFANNLVKVKINGVVQQQANFWIRAKLMEDFSTLSGTELASSPVFKVASNSLNVGKIKNSSQTEIEFRFVNDGKRDLFIRDVKSSCGCTAVKDGSVGVAIKPGEAGSIKAVFNSTGYTGPVTKAIFVYTNDPKNPEVVLVFNAEVDAAEVIK